MKGLTWDQLFEAIFNLGAHNMEFRAKEVEVFLDFPTDGRNKKYKISQVTKNGIILYNDETQRPVGH